MAYDWEKSEKIGIIFSKQPIKGHIYGMLDDGRKIHIGKWQQDGSRYKAMLFESAYIDEEDQVANEYNSNQSGTVEITSENKPIIEEEDDIPF